MQEMQTEVLEPNIIWVECTQIKDVISDVFPPL